LVDQAVRAWLELEGGDSRSSIPLLFRLKERSFSQIVPRSRPTLEFTRLRVGKDTLIIDQLDQQGMVEKRQGSNRVQRIVSQPSGLQKNA
jgi:hypothetical protein